MLLRLTGQLIRGKTGSIGNMGCFSFQNSKNVPAGYIAPSSTANNIGRKVGIPGYLHLILSSNYRITEFQGALLLSQMKHLSEWTELKHENGEYLAGELTKLGGVEPLKFCTHQQVTLPHTVLMADRSGIQMIIDSISKIKDNIDELTK